MSITLFSTQSFAQHAKPSQGQRLLPAVFGTWRTGTLLIAEKGGLKPAVPVDSMEETLTLLPTGVRVEFKPDYDPVAGEYLSVMNILPPFPAESCQYAALWGHCVGEEGKRQPNPNQQPISREFSLETTKEDIVTNFASVGATANSVCYRVHGNGHSWEGNFYVSKDRQTMWTTVSIDIYTLLPDGTRRKSESTAACLQAYHRVPDATKSSAQK